MKLRFASAVFAALAIASVIFSLAVSSQAQTDRVLYTFTKGGSGGETPLAGVIADKKGNLYGTTGSGGSGGLGTVYKLSPASSGSWTETTLYEFSPTTVANGASPVGSLVFDTQGNLYGTTSQGGSSTACSSTGCGVVFELSPTSSGAWTYRVLHTFVETDGAFPAGGLIFDKAGNLYGAAGSGGNLNDCKWYNFGCGVVFELSPNSDGTWSESVLYAFTGLADGMAPASPLLFDEAGNLYGTAGFGGIFAQPCPLWKAGCGVVFELSPSSSGAWTETVLHAFDSTDGRYLEAGLARDAAGNLYGTAGWGGAYDHGNVFELSPGSNGTWTESTLYNFAGLNDSGLPVGQLALDAAGNLYGGAAEGGGQKCGTIFVLSPSATGWTEKILHRFTCGGDGGLPNNVILDAQGRLYGTASNENGTANEGVVFRITP